jgi:hypothetical protein
MEMPQALWPAGHPLLLPVGKFLYFQQFTVGNVLQNRHNKWLTSKIVTTKELWMWSPVK